MKERGQEMKRTVDKWTCDICLCVTADSEEMQDPYSHKDNTGWIHLDREEQRCLDVCPRCAYVLSRAMACARHDGYDIECIAAAYDSAIMGMAQSS